MSQCVLRGDARVFTRGGTPRVAELSGRVVELATADLGWVSVRVAPARAPLVRVALSDGGVMVTGAATAWPLAAECGGGRAARTDALWLGARLDPRASAPLAPALATRAPRRGGMGGASARPGRAPPPELSSRDLAACAAGRAAAARGDASPREISELNLEGSEARAFLDGWADYRGGFLVGTQEQVSALRALARRAGAVRSFLSNGAGHACLFADGVWPPASGCARRWGRPLSNDGPCVVEIAARPRRGAFRLELAGPGEPALVAVDGAAVYVESATPAPFEPRPFLSAAASSPAASVESAILAPPAASCRPAASVESASLAAPAAPGLRGETPC